MGEDEEVEEDERVPAAVPSTSTEEDAVEMEMAEEEDEDEVRHPVDQVVDSYRSLHRIRAFRLVTFQHICPDRRVW